MNITKPNISFNAHLPLIQVRKYSIIGIPENTYMALVITTSNLPFK